MQSPMNKCLHVGVNFDCGHYIFKDIWHRRWLSHSLAVAMIPTVHSTCMQATLELERACQQYIFIDYNDVIYLLFIIIAFTNYYWTNWIITNGTATEIVGDGMCIIYQFGDWNESHIRVSGVRIRNIFWRWSLSSWAQKLCHNLKINTRKIIRRRTATYYYYYYNYWINFRFHSTEINSIFSANAAHVDGSWRLAK